jgi:cyanophycinase
MLPSGHSVWPMSTAVSFGPLALVGSGEFLPQMVEVDRWLLQRQTPRVAILPTAAGEEGQASVDRWIRLGVDHYTAMGIEPVALRVLNRDDASRADLAAELADVGLIYLSGGNPGYVASVLHGSLVGDAIAAAWRSGTAVAGCSAGAVALTSRASRVRGGAMGTVEAALGLVPHITVIPHFDQMHRWNPGFLDRALVQRGTGEHLVGVDEDTALVGGPDNWTVMGRQRVTVFGADGSMAYTAGDSVSLPSVSP